MHLFVLRIIRSKNGANAEHRHDVPSAPTHAQNTRRQTRTKRGGDDIELRLGNSMHFCPKGKAQQVHIDVSWCRRDERHLFAHWAGLILHAVDTAHPQKHKQERKDFARTRAGAFLKQAYACDCAHVFRAICLTGTRTGGVVGRGSGGLIVLVFVWGVTLRTCLDRKPLHPSTTATPNPSLRRTLVSRITRCAACSQSTHAEPSRRRHLQHARQRPTARGGPPRQQARRGRGGVVQGSCHQATCTSLHHRTRAKRPQQALGRQGVNHGGTTLCSCTGHSRDAPRTCSSR